MISLQPRSDGSDSVMDWCVLCLSLCMTNADDPAGWAGLMAACHTENTACLLQGSAPRRENLERAHMTLVSEKGQWDLRMSCPYICIYADGSMPLKRCVLCVRSVLSEGPAGRRRALGSGSGGMGAAAGCDWTQTEWPTWPGRDSLLPGTHTHTHACFLFICHAVPYWCVSCVNRAQVQTQTGWPVLGFQREPCARFMRWHGTICLISICCGFLSAHNAWAVPLWGVFVKQECPVLLLKG